MAYYQSVIEKDGIKFLDLQEDYSAYHKANDGRASNAVREFMNSHDNANSYVFYDSDIADLYGMALEQGEGSINFAELIKLSIYAGMCAAEWADAPDQHVSKVVLSDSIGKSVF